MHRPWARRTVAPEAWQRILSHLVSRPDLLTTVAALFYYPPWRGPSLLALEALRWVVGSETMTTPGGERTLYKVQLQLPPCSAHRLLSWGRSSDHTRGTGLRSFISRRRVFLIWSAWPYRGGALRCYERVPELRRTIFLSTTLPRTMQPAA